MRLAIAVVLSRVIYLDHTGVSLTPGENDSRTQKSSLVTGPVYVPRWDVDDHDWGATVACMRGMWAPFDVTVTDVDPGDVPHIEVVIGGSAADIGLAVNAGGVSPFRSDCGVVENSIVFAFTDVLHDRPQIVCEVASQEIGHSYGLDHELLAADPMTYLPYAHARTFQDETAACGETVARPCGAACRPNQNSVQILRDRLGPHRDVGDIPADGVPTDPEPSPGVEEPAGCVVGGGDVSAWLFAALALGIGAGPQRRRRAADST